MLRFWLDLGIDGFRADAVPYLYEREGTNSENLPETHVFLKKVRRLMDEEYPGRVLIAVANQWPEDLLPYFGDGDEFHVCFHFPIMPRLYMALKRGDCRWPWRDDGLVRSAHCSLAVPADRPAPGDGTDVAAQ